MSGTCCNESVVGLREYDSLISLLKSSAKRFRHGCFSLPTVAYQVNCFDVCEQYLTLGWCDGNLSIVAKNSGSVVHSFKLQDTKKTLFSNNRATCIPVGLDCRLMENFVVVCSAYTHKSDKSVPSDTSQSMIHIYRMPIKDESIIFKKAVRFVIRSMDQNRYLARPYVSTNGDLVITGDSRGMVTAYRFNHKLSSYYSSVLTVVPGYVRNLYVHGSLLLIAAQPFPQDRRYEEDDLVEIVGSESSLIYLFDLSTTTLVTLNLEAMLPRLEPALQISCPVWLTKGNSGNCPTFVCSIAQPSSSCTQARNDIGISHAPNGILVAAVFVVNNVSVSLQRLVYVDCCSRNLVALRIPVLPSAISTASQRVGISSTYRPEFAQLDHSHFHRYFAHADKSVSVLSDKTLLLWSNSRPIIPAVDVELGVESFLTVLELEVDNESESPTPHTLARLVAYSNQLGGIQSIIPCWLKQRIKPTVPYVPHRNNGYSPTSICTNLELWIQRSVPLHLQNDVPNLVLLSTRPLCASRLAIAPSVDLAALFSEQRRNETYHLQHSSCYSLASMTRQTANQISSQPCSNQLFTRNRLFVDTFQQGVEVGVDCLLLEPQSVSPEHQPEAQPGQLQPLPPTSPDIHDGNTTETVIMKQDVSSLVEAGVQLTTTLNASNAQPTGQARSVQQTLAEDNSTKLTGSSSTSCLEQVTTEEKPRCIDTLQNIDARQIGQSLDAEEHIKQQISPTSASTASTKGDFTCSREASIVDDSWLLYRCPKVSSIDLVKFEAKIDSEGLELIPFVTFDGTPGILLWQADGSPPDWILAPTSFGSVYSLNISPNRDIVWCLRAPNKQPETWSGYAVDVLTERNGLRSLCTAWLSGQLGHWESNALRRVTNLDFGTSFALFTTVTGTVKIQFGLSSRRPCGQSYTWPCPGYHLLQSSISETGIVWALAVSKNTAVTDDSQFDFSTEELCLLTALIPDELQSNTQRSPSVIADRLRASRWYPMLLPPLIQSSFQTLLKNATSLEQLTMTVNEVLQLGFSIQSDRPVKEEQTHCSHLAVGWLFVRPPLTEQGTFSSAFRGCEDVDDSLLYGCVFFIPHLRPHYKPDDLNWCQAPIGGVGGKSLSKKSLQSLFKHSGGSTSHPPLVKFPTRVFANLLSEYHLTEHRLDSSVNCLLPMWLVVQRPLSNTTILARVRASLSAYQWSKHRIHVQTIRSGSPLSDDYIHCQHIWQFPLLVQLSAGESNHPAEDNTYCLWTVNSISNELFCHLGLSYSRSLTIPALDSKRDAITSMCVVPDARSDVFHLLIATRAGILCSRIGLSASAPIGISWTTESCPAYWESPPGPLSSHGEFKLHFTSLACVNSELWATDNLGNLCSTHICFTHDNSGTPRLLTSTWTVHIAASTSTISDSPSSSIYFFSIAAADWQSRGFGVSLWAVGVPMGEAKKLNLPSRSADTVTSPLPGLLYTRCWNPTTESHFWLHVPALNVRSVHVTSKRVWILSGSRIPQIFVRRGIRSNSTRSALPGPTEEYVGHSWQPVPPPDPLSHQIIPDCLSVWSSRYIDSCGATPPFDLIVISQNGDLIRLNVPFSIRFTGKNDLPLDASTDHANNNLVLVMESEDIVGI